MQALRRPPQLCATLPARHVTVDDSFIETRDVITLQLVQQVRRGLGVIEMEGVGTPLSSGHQKKKKSDY